MDQPSDASDDFPSVLEGVMGWFAGLRDEVLVRRNGGRKLTIMGGERGGGIEGTWGENTSIRLES